MPEVGVRDPGRSSRRASRLSSEFWGESEGREHDNSSHTNKTKQQFIFISE